MIKYLGLILVALAACHGNSPGDDVVQSTQPRLSVDNVPASDVTLQSRDNSSFAFDLYAQLAKTPGNLFFSPYSISSALAMTWAGAAGDTATGMAGALDFTMPATRVHAAFNALDVALASRAQSAYEGVRPFRLHVVNAIWGQKGLLFQPPFLDTLAENYGAGVRIEDFADDAESSRSDINAWVRQNTDGKIPVLLAPGSIDSDTRVVLTNAVYFNAAWAVAFLPENTHPAPFHLLDGTTSTVPLMYANMEVGYASGSGWQAVELPYSNPLMALTVLVPDDGQFAAVEAQLSADFLDAVIGAERPTGIDLKLPKFKAQTQASLKDPLTALGMGQAFSGDADFSAIDGGRDLSIKYVVHQATVSVDEAGTEAAAATAVVLGDKSIPLPGSPLTIDRPFIIMLRDLPTGTVLFAGRVVAP